MLARNLLLFGGPKRPFLYDFTAADVLPAGVTLTRASVGQVFGSTLALEQKAVDVQRFAYDLSSGLPRGLLIEAARTNGIRNNTMVGGVAGTPGTQPNLWNMSTSQNNLTRQVVAIGAEDGINYIDVRFSGTPNATTAAIAVFDGSSNVAAADGQTWTASVYLRLVAGTLTNLTITQLMSARNSGGTFVDGNSVGRTPTSAALKTQRYSTTKTIAGATIAGIDQEVRFGYTNGLAVDFTIRIGLPQLEQGDDASTPIKTSSAAATRSADLATITASQVISYNTVVVRARTPLSAGASVQALWQTDDGTNNNRMIIYRSSGNMFFQAIAGGVANATLSLGAVGNDTDFAIAVRLLQDDFAASLNGGAVQTDTSATRPTVNATRLGMQVATGHWNSTIKSVQYRPNGEANAVLQSLSA